ncbi:efflux RND transporter periplasmic adaptor subunit [Stakelama sediminis]|uniref:Cobalt-zinc-cadmium efflux system membrane fusion protein n=1 Tax=Stakelama sediminis TaxID=463200 RepID=A0A840Z1F0_9SPHN|nr:efflux RND transporter periplasmic adaptor subunit [Stakelama sediminis]MBB5719723.1 cobalt-zinc-cadmium efflux system membrane fusion protein [Stakelama sediminis]
MREPKRHYLAFTAALLLAGCGGGTDTAPAPDKTPSTPAGTVPLSNEQATKLGLKWAVAERADEAPIATLPATIAPPPNARVAVTATYPGMVKRIYVAEGDTVKAGQLLATVASTDILSHGADLARAEARLRVAGASASRLTQLAREGVIAGARADEAQAQLRQAQADVTEQRRILAMTGAAGRDGTYRLTAPIAGRVAKASVETGDRIDPMEASFVVDAASRYEIRAQLPQKFIGQIRPGMSVRVKDGVGGTVTSVGNVIDPETRAALLKASVPGAPGIVSGGTTSVTIYGPAPDGAVMVPDAAVTNLGDGDIVFVAAKGGVSTRSVRQGPTVEGRTLILSGLKPGEKVVASGTSELKALALAQ